MENGQIDKPKSKKEVIKRNYLLKKIDLDTAKLMNQIREKSNKKPYGRKVTDTEIISAALKLLTQDHIKELQQNTYSEKDRLAMAHEDFQRTNAKISLDQFIGKLLKGEITPKAT
jgi:hypothetical protein